MLGALVVFLQFLLYGYCWRLNKKLSALRKSESPIPISQFVLCSVINFIVLVPIIAVPIYLLGLALRFERSLGENGFTLFGITVSIVIVFSIVFYQYLKYKNYFKRSNILKPMIDKSADIVGSAKVMLTSPNSFIESYPFVDFVERNGPNVGIVSHINRLTGGKFHTVEVRNAEGRTVSIRFHSSLGELTAEQLRDKKYELFVGKRSVDRNWYLYDSNYKDRNWRDVDLGL